MKEEWKLEESVYNLLCSFLRCHETGDISERGCPVSLDPGVDRCGAEPQLDP